MPSWQELIDWIEGRLSPADAARVKQQMVGAGDETTTDISWIRAFLRASSEVILDDPPADLRNALRARFSDFTSAKAESVEAEAGPNVLQRLVAVLSFDSGLQPGLAGARASNGGVRRMIYATDVLDISMSVLHDIHSVRIDGQIFPLKEMPLDVFDASIEQRSHVVAKTSVDANGVFSFAAIRPDTYQFSLGSQGLNIRIESLDLRE